MESIPHIVDRAKNSETDEEHIAVLWQAYDEAARRDAMPRGRTGARVKQLRKIIEDTLREFAETDVGNELLGVAERLTRQR